MPNLVQKTSLCLLLKSQTLFHSMKYKLKQANFRSLIIEINGFVEKLFALPQRLSIQGSYFHSSDLYALKHVYFIDI